MDITEIVTTAIPTIGTILVAWIVNIKSKQIERASPSASGAGATTPNNSLIKTIRKLAITSIVTFGLALSTAIYVFWSALDMRAVEARYQPLAFATGFDQANLREESSITGKVTFDPPFAMAPQVYLGVTGYDDFTSGNTSIKITAIYKNGFEYAASRSVAHRLDEIEFTWFALGPSTQDGDIYVWIEPKNAKSGLLSEE